MLLPRNGEATLQMKLLIKLRGDVTRRQLAFGILSLPWIGARPMRIMFAFGAVAAFISAWVANAATTARRFG